MKIKQINEKIYNTNLLFIYSAKASEAEMYLHKKGIRAYLTKCSGVTGVYVLKKSKESEQIRFYMYIEESKIELQALVHEISHLVFMSLNECGIKVTVDTDEVFAYYFDWWFKKLAKLIWDKNNI